VSTKISNNNRDYGKIVRGENIYEAIRVSFKNGDQASESNIFCKLGDVLERIDDLSEY